MPTSGLRSPRHQGVYSPPRNHLATSQLATKRSLLATNDALNKSNTKPHSSVSSVAHINIQTVHGHDRVWSNTARTIDQGDELFTW